MFSAKFKGLKFLLLAAVVFASGCESSTPPPPTDDGNTPAIRNAQIVTIHSPLANGLYAHSNPVLNFTAKEGELVGEGPEQEIVNAVDLPKERLRVSVHDMVGGRPENTKDLFDVLSGVNLPSMLDGLHKLEFQVDNSATDQGDFITIIFYQTDATAPLITIQFPAAEFDSETSTWITTDASKILEYVTLDECFSFAENPCTAEISIDGVPKTLPELLKDPACTHNCLPVFGDGNYEVKIVLIDTAGNRTELLFTVIIDSTPPEVIVVQDPPPAPPPAPPPGEEQPAPAPTVKTTLSGTILFFSSDTDGSAEVFLDGTTSLKTFDSVKAGAEYSVDLAGTPDGVHTANIVVTGADEQRGTASVPFIADATAPEIVVVVGSPGGPVLIQPNISTNQDSGYVIFYANEGGDATVVLDRGTAGQRELVQFTQMTANTPYSTLVSGLTEGGHTITIEMMDRLRNETVTEFSFAVDFNAPAVTLNFPGDGKPFRTFEVPMSLSYSDAVTAQGDLQVAVTVKTWDVDSGQWISADTQVTEVTCCAISVNQDGIYEVTVEVTDQSLKTGWMSARFSVDTTPPVVDIRSPKEEMTPDNTPLLDVFSNEQSSYDVRIFRFSGPYRDYTDQDLAEHLRIDGKIVQADGTPLPDGQHTVVVELTDAAGWVGSDWATFTVEAQGPEVGILSPGAGDIITTGQLAVQYNVHDASHVEIYLNLAGSPLPAQPAATRVIDPVVSDSVAYTDTLPVPGDGDYTVTVKAFDRTHDQVLESPTATVNFTANSTGVEITAPNADNRTFRSTETIGLTFNYNPAYDIYVYVDGVGGRVADPASQPVTLSPPADGWAIGSHTIEVVGKNTSGNVSDSIEFFIDDATVEIELKSPQEGREYECCTVTVHYHLHEADWVETEKVYLDGVEIKDMTHGEHGHYNTDGHKHTGWKHHRHRRWHHHRNHVYKVVDLTPGGHTITVRAFDKDGRELGAASAAFSVKKKPQRHRKEGYSSCYHDDEDRSKYGIDWQKCRSYKD